jgi:hypothetical protein
MAVATVEWVEQRLYLHHQGTSMSHSRVVFEFQAVCFDPRCSMPGNGRLGAVSRPGNTIKLQCNKGKVWARSLADVIG